MVEVDTHPHHEIRSAVALERGATVEQGGWTCTGTVGPRPHFLLGQTPYGHWGLVPPHRWDRVAEETDRIRPCIVTAWGTSPVPQPR